MTAVIIPIVAAVVGATAASLAAFLRDRARPTIVVDEIRRSPNVIPDDSVVLPQLELISDCDDSPFLAVDQLPDKPQGTQYVAFLDSLLEQIDNALDRLPRIEAAGAELSRCVTRQDFPYLDSFFTRQQKLVSSFVIGAAIRGEFQYDPAPNGSWSLGLAQLAEAMSQGGLPAAAPRLDDRLPGARAPVQQAVASVGHGQPDGHRELADDGSPQCFRDTVADVSAGGVRLRLPGWRHDLFVDPDGDFVIPLSGPRNLVFPASNVPSARRGEGRAVAAWIAAAFGSRNRDDLLTLAQFLSHARERYSDRLVDLRRRILEERTQFERLVIRGTIANSGGSSFSITNRGRLFIRLQGKRYTADDGERAVVRYPSDEELPLRVALDHGKDKRSFDEPLLVEPGSVVRFVAASTTPIPRLACADVLIASMAGGDRTCYVGLNGAARGQRRVLRRKRSSQFGYYYSGDQPFLDYREDVTIPPKGRRGLRQLAA